MAGLRAAAGKPVATREPIDRYETTPSLLALGDWVFALAHPHEENATHPQAACGVVANRFVALRRQVAPDRHVMLETGLPTAGEATLSENGQRAFLACIETRAVRFAYTAAFDASTPTPRPVDAHAGLFRADGTPKMWAASLARPALLVRVRPGYVRGVVGRAAPENFRVVTYSRGEEWMPGDPVVISRWGKWRARGDAAAALLVAPRFVPRGPVGRLPQVDGVDVFAVVDATSGRAPGLR
jgi:hypothetical protein